MSVRFASQIGYKRIAQGIVKATKGGGSDEDRVDKVRNNE